MTTAPPTDDEQVAPRKGGDGSVMIATHRGTLGDNVFKWVALVAGLTVLAILLLITWSTTREAWPAFEEEGIDFVLSDDWNPAAGQFGALAFIYGTIVSSLIALVLAVPVSLGIALYTNEAAPRRLKTAVVYVIDLLAAIPSVVYGLWGVLVLSSTLDEQVYTRLNDWFGGWPVLGWIFGGTTSGRSFMTAGVILAIMITPIITSLSREVIATVPASQREAAYGMGATRWEMIRAAVLPWARGGIVGSVMLGLGRALGETIAVALVIGSFPQITSYILEQGDAMAAVIANQFGESSGVSRSALIGLGVLLFGLTIIVNVAARAIVGHFDRRSQGA